MSKSHKSVETFKNIIAHLCTNAENIANGRKLIPKISLEAIIVLKVPTGSETNRAKPKLNHYV